MTALGRAFVAVVPPPEVLVALAAHVEPWRDRVPGLRWSGPERWHLTLQFLGSVADAEAVAAALRAELAASPPVRLRLGGAGAFPSARRASVVWVGLVEGADDLGALAGSVVAATASIGDGAGDGASDTAGDGASDGTGDGAGDGTSDRADARPFTAHLTVARAARRRDVRHVVAGLGEGAVGPAWSAREVVLMQSDTHPDGVRHTAWATVPLVGDGA